MLSKTIPAVIIAILLLMVSNALAVEGVASRTGKKYHLKTCQFDKKIPKSHIISFISPKVNMEPIPEHNSNLVGSTKVHAQAVYVLARIPN